MNKRADVSSVVVVIMCLALFGMIFGAIAINRNSISRDINSVFFSGSAYSKEKSLEVSVRNILVEAFLNAYQKVLDEDKVLEDDFRFENYTRLEFVKIIGESEVVGRALAEGFKSEIQINLIAGGGENLVIPKNTQGYNGGLVDDIIFNQNTINSPDFQQTLDNLMKNNIIKPLKNSEGVSFTLTNWEYKFTSGGTSDSFRADYTGDVIASVKFEELELLSFKDIKNNYNSCKSKEVSVLDSCLNEKFKKFNVKLISNTETQSSGVTSYVRVYELESVNDYYINKEMKKIKFKLTYTG